jgi:hypothetical protein
MGAAPFRNSAFGRDLMTCGCNESVDSSELMNDVFFHCSASRRAKGCDVRNRQLFGSYRREWFKQVRRRWRTSQFSVIRTLPCGRIIVPVEPRSVRSRLDLLGKLLSERLR